MNRHDIVFISVVFILSLTLFLSTSRIAKAINAHDSVAIARYRDREVMRMNMDKDAFYTVTGDQGDVVIEIKNGRIRVAEEVSPRHYCSMQGWVDKTNVPIVCLPNRVVIEVQDTSHASEEDISIR